MTRARGSPQNEGRPARLVPSPSGNNGWGAHTPLAGYAAGGGTTTDSTHLLSGNRLPVPRRFLTTAEVADYLKCSRSHVHALIAAGTLPAWKPSPRKTLIPIGALERIEDAVLAGVSDAALERALAARHGTTATKGVRKGGAE